jgi:hypothetical protein
MTRVSAISWNSQPCNGIFVALVLLISVSERHARSLLSLAGANPRANLGLTSRGSAPYILERVVDLPKNLKAQLPVIEFRVSDRPRDSRTRRSLLTRSFA